MAGTDALRAAFDLFDLDKDGRISAAEFQQVMLEVGAVEVSESQARSLLAVADADGDGLITWDEFLAARDH